MRQTDLRKTPFLEKDPPRQLWFFTILLFLVIIGGGAASVFLPDKFTVNEITVSDTRKEVADGIKKYVGQVIKEKATLFGKTNIFLVPRDYLENDLPAKFPIIHTVQILRELPNKINISVQEKVPVALLFSGGSYYALDPLGVAFEEISAEKVKENKYPLIRDERESAEIQLGKSVINTDTISMLHDITKQMPDRFNLAVSEITIPAIGTQELHVHTSENWVLYLDATRSLDSQFIVLDKILTEEIDPQKRPNLSYIDLRIQGKAFYLYRDGA